MIRHNLRRQNHTGKIRLHERSDHHERKKTQRKSFQKQHRFKQRIVLRENISLSESLGLCFLVTAPIGIVCVFTLQSSGRRASRGESEMSRHASYVTSLH